MTTFSDKSKELIDETIRKHYKKSGNREVCIFMHGCKEDWYYTGFLLERKHVIRFAYGPDRYGWTGGIQLAIGPDYFGPSDFWSPENAERFLMEWSPDALVRNLMLLDEFLGYPTPKPWETPAARI